MPEPTPRPLVDIRRDFFATARETALSETFSERMQAAARLEALARELVREEDRLKALGVNPNV